MSDVISPLDHDLIRAFLVRESKMYNWVNGLDGPECKKFIERMMSQILEAGNPENPAFNYVHVQSITNLGLLDSKLVLSSSHLDPSRDLYMALPPSPKGSLSVKIVE